MRPIVIKVGGAFMQSPQHATELLQVIKRLQLNRKVVLIHGGGPMVEELLQALGLTSTKINGLRVTPDEHMAYIVGALAGTANKQLCGLAIAVGLSAVGLCLADGNMLQCEQLSPQLGAVGKATAGQSKLLDLLLSADYLPIISSIGADPAGRLLNINADQAATAIAQLLDGELFLLSDVSGVLDGEKQLLASLDNQQIDLLIQQQVIQGGMQVKVQAALDAAHSLQRAVSIASWKNAEVLLGLLDNQNVGTKIIYQQSDKDSA
jgi:acetylglutamate kinase